MDKRLFHKVEYNNPSLTGSFSLIAYGVAAFSLQERTDPLTKVGSSAINLIQAGLTLARHATDPTTASLSALPITGLLNLFNAVMPWVPEEVPARHAIVTFAA